MADVLQARADRAITASVGENNAAGFNLVDLATPLSTDKPQARQPAVPRTEVVNVPVAAPHTFHLPRPTSDADLNRRNTILDPIAWDDSAAMRKIYENGLLKIFADPAGKQQFGLKISDQKSDRLGSIPVREQRLKDKGVSLELRLKF